jgi:hypothetical protein
LSQRFLQVALSKKIPYNAAVLILGFLRIYQVSGYAYCVRIYAFGWLKIVHGKSHARAIEKESADNKYSDAFYK